MARIIFADYYICIFMAVWFSLSCTSLIFDFILYNHFITIYCALQSQFSTKMILTEKGLTWISLTLHTTLHCPCLKILGLAFNEEISELTKFITLKTLICSFKARPRFFRQGQCRVSDYLYFLMKKTEQKKSLFAMVW